MRRRRALALVAALASLGALVFTLVAPVGSGLGSLAPERAAPAPPARGRSVLLAWPTTEPSGAVAVLLGAPPGGGRPSALLVPGGTHVEVPSLGSQTVGSALTTAGVDRLALALENALGYGIGDAVALDAAALAGLFGPAGAERLASSPGGDASELDHLVVVHGVFEGWLAGLDGPGLDRVREAMAATIGDDRRASRVSTVLSAVAAGDVRFDTLDVVPLGVPGGERYAVADTAASEMATLFPGLALGGGTRVRVEILNGTGRAGLAGEAAGLLVPAGAHVVLTGNVPGFGVGETVLVLQDPRFEDRAERLAGVLGAGRIHTAREPVGVVDVSIVLGADFDPGVRD